MKPTIMMMSRLVAISIVFFLSIVQCLAGQDQRLKVLTLSEAVQTAVKKNPKVSAAAFRIEESAARITQARSGLIPQVHFREGYSYITNPMWAFGTKLNQQEISSQDFNPDRLNNPDAISNFGSVLGVNWSLYDSGQTWYGLKQARLSKKTEGLFMKRTRQQVIAQTVTAYIGLLLAQKNMFILEQTLATAHSHLKMVQSRYKNGFVVKSDLLRAQVHIADLDQQMLQAESKVQIERAYLNAAMGVSFETHYDLVTPLEIGKEIQDSLERWLDTALSKRPDLEQLRNQETIAKVEITKSRSARLPSVNLLGNYEWNTDDFSNWADNYTLGAVLNVNLFSGRRLSGKIAQARATLKKVKAHQQELKQGIIVQTRQAFLLAQSARKRIQVTQAAIVQAKETLRIVRNRYDSGLLTIVALLDAELALQQAQTNHFKSIHDYRVAAAQLALAAGTIDDNFN